MERAALLELAERIERYDPKLSPDNRSDELALHQDIVMATGEGSLTCEFDRTFVRSLDAAMTLVPKGYCWSLDTLDGTPEAIVAGFGPDLSEPVKAATPALALCAADLRAQATEQGSGDRA